MRRRFSMFAICGSKSAITEDESDKITDGLEQCLSVDRGVKEFHGFLRKRRFDDDEAALQFYVKCRNILTDLAKYSPSSRNHSFSKRVNADIGILYEMAGEVNFDQYQMEDLERTFTCGSDQDKIDKIAEAQKWSMDILQQIYEAFRKEVLTNKG